MANGVYKPPFQVGGTMLGLRIDKFEGINTINDEVDLPIGMLKMGRNVDITRIGNVKRRRGSTQIIAGEIQSLWSNGVVCLSVLNGDLIFFNSDWSYNILMSGMGSSPVSYDYVNDIVYFTNGSVIGFVQDGVASVFGSPPQYPLFKRTTPPGQLLAYFNARLYVASGNVLWITDPLNFGIVDARRGFKQLPTDIIMMLPVNNGIYISDKENTYFMLGLRPEEFQLIHLLPYPAVAGTGLAIDAASLVKIPDKLTFNLTKEGQGIAAIWLSTHGIITGDLNGQILNRTEMKYAMPNCTSGTALLRKNNESKQYITTMVS
jgi:hypothetical protein